MPAKRLKISWSAVPAIIADLIIAAAKNGERHPGRLYEKILKAYGIDDTGSDLPVPAYAWSRKQRDFREPG
jgi:hypothetical protein